MKTSNLVTTLVAGFSCIWLVPVLSGFAAPDSAIEAVAGKAPLDNRELHKLRRELGNGEDMSKKIKGTEVKVMVTVHIRQDKTVWCEVLNPDEDGGWGCRAHLTGFEPHFSSGLEEGEDYLLEGMIVEDSIDFGAFWIYSSRLTRAEQAGAGQPATRSELNSKGGDKPQPESEEHSR